MGYQEIPLFIELWKYDSFLCCTKLKTETHSDSVISTALGYVLLQQGHIEQSRIIAEDVSLCSPEAGFSLMGWVHFHQKQFRQAEKR